MTLVDPPLPLHASNLSVERGGKALLENVTFSLEPQQSLAVLGVNGAGKSTLLKTIVGLQPDFTGTCLLFGYPPSNALSRKKVVYLPERPKLPNLMRGQEYLRFVLRLYRQKLNLSELQMYAGLLGFDLVHLPKFTDQYSKGLIQKLMLIGMFLSKPQLMILDEVMSGLDMVARPRVRQLLQDYCAGGGSVLFTTHLLEDVQSFATNVMVLHQGKIKFQGESRLLDESNLEY